MNGNAFMTAEQIHKRLKRLLLEVESYVSSSSVAVLEAHFISSMNLIGKVFATSSEYYKSLEHWKDSIWDYDLEASASLLRTLLAHALQDYESGLATDLDTRITGEVISDLLRLARTALSDGQKDVAAVLVAAALEDSLKRLARLHGLQLAENASLSTVISALKSEGLRVGGQKGLLSSLPHFRNAAMHANWAAITEADVAGAIAFVEEFLVRNF